MAARIRTVGLNALFLAPGQAGGPETYLRGLVPALAGEFPATRFVVFTTRTGAAALRRDSWPDFVEIVGLPIDPGQRVRRLVVEQMILPWRSRGRLDLLHSLASIAPVRTPVPAVITLHDVTFLRIRTFSRGTTVGFRATVGPAARRAAALLTGSMAARDEICSLLGLAPERFLVVPHGPGRVPVDATLAESDTRKAHRLEGKRVVLCVAAKRPHKNQEVLIRASQLLPDDVVVVLAGYPEPYDAELRSLADELGVGDRMRFLDIVPDDELEALWRVAGCVAFPTLGEGFGLPVLEAMARGAPVACSDIPVLREVGGELPFYFDPRDPVGAATAIEAALGDGERIPAGRERAATFTWENAARGTYEAYERAMTSARS